MDIIEAMKLRHSVRQYEDRQIENEKAELLRNETEAINKESGLHFQLILNEAEAFDGNAPHYGNFSGCKNYFALVGKPDRDEDIGYFGERLVLFAQSIGLNTCWAALTFKKKLQKAIIADDEKLYVLISLGYGKTNGVSHKSKGVDDVSECKGDMPEWFKNGVEAALLAPTAINQQRFCFKLNRNGKVEGKTHIAICGKIDLGIAKYHFELGAGKNNFEWENK